MREKIKEITGRMILYAPFIKKQTKGKELRIWLEKLNSQILKEMEKEVIKAMPCNSCKLAHCCCKEEFKSNFKKIFEE